MSSPKLRFTVATAILGCTVLLAQGPQPRASPGLNLAVVAGEGGSGKVLLRSTSDTIVQVEDGNHKPVAWATVVFLLPATGPGGTFATGSKTAIVVTGSDGRAVMPAIDRNSMPGKYQIRVHASHEAREADVAITQTSVAAPAKSAGIIVCVVAAVAAGAGAAVVTSHGKGKASPPAAPTLPSGSIGAGSGIFIGPPR